MPLIANAVKQRLAGNELAIGLNTRQARTVDIAPIAKACGFDWLMIDLEHNSMNIDTAAQICVTALGYGVAPIVRVPGPEHWQSTRLLDAGAQGIIVPHVSTEAEARRVVYQCKYPPFGERSLTGGLPQLAFAASNAPVAELLRQLNDNMLLVVMLESAEAIANADAIAAVDGIDVLLIGTNDLCADLGIPGQLGHERVVDAYAKMIAACRRHHRSAGMAGIYDHALMERYIGMGVRFLQGGVDLALLMAGGRARVDFLRSLKLG